MPSLKEHQPSLKTDQLNSPKPVDLNLLFVEVGTVLLGKPDLDDHMIHEFHKLGFTLRPIASPTGMIALSVEQLKGYKMEGIPAAKLHFRDVVNPKNGRHTIVFESDDASLNINKPLAQTGVFTRVGVFQIEDETGYQKAYLVKAIFSRKPDGSFSVKTKVLRIMPKSAKLS